MQHKTTSRKQPLVIVAIGLGLCLLLSLALNVAAGGWAWMTGRESDRAQALAATSAIESEGARSSAATLEAELDAARTQAATQQAGFDALQQTIEAWPAHPTATLSATATPQADVVPTLDPADGALMDTVQRQVVTLRGLEALHPVERRLVTRAQLLDYMTQQFEETYSPAEMRDDALVLSTFDALDPELDLYALMLDLYVEQVAGFYDPEDEQIYVVVDDDRMGQAERLTYAHEYTHALQDQHYDLEALGLRDGAEREYDDDHLVAVRALVEGDATLLMQHFLAAHYTREEMGTLMEEMRAMESPVLDAAPAVVGDSLMFPYVYGQHFVQALYDAGGWQAVDAAYADPPRSTEHILHPERYLADDQPQIVVLSPLTATLGVGWRQIEANVAGEYFLRYYLSQQVRSQEARVAAEGWCGDRYVVHTREADDGLVMALQVVWDTPADAEEFVDAYVTYAQARFGHTADLVQGARRCWSGEIDDVCVAWSSVDTTVVLGPDQATVTSVLDVLTGESLPLHQTLTFP